MSVDNFEFLDKEKQVVLDSFEKIASFYKQREITIQKEKERYLSLQNKLISLLKTQIGKPIYWASPAWNKYETHTITDVRLEKVESDFFGKEYVGKECVKIFVNDGKSYYIADNIGDTLFFTEKDAYEHTATYRREKGETL